MTVVGQIQTIDYIGKYYIKPMMVYNMKIQLDIFKTKLVETKASDSIDYKSLQEFLKNFYKTSPASATDIPVNMDAVRSQVKQICKYCESRGLKKFDELMEKFASSPNNETNARMMHSIKETMEAIMYAVSESKMSQDQLSSQFNDRIFACKEGTLTNLQQILSEITLATKGIDDFLIEQKKQVITQITLEMLREGSFKELWRKAGREIHNVSALLNSIADEFKLLRKSAEEDKRLKSDSITGITVKDTSRAILLSKIEYDLGNQNVINGIIDGTLINIEMLLPSFDENNAQKFGGEVSDILSQAKFTKASGYVIPSCILKTDENSVPTGYKANKSEILRNAVICHMHDSKLLKHHDYEFIKFTLKIEEGSEPYGVSTELLDEAKEKGFLERTMKYILDNKLGMEQDLDPIDPIKYAIENDIMIDGKHPKIYIIDKLSKEYFKTKDPIVRNNIDNDINIILKIDVPEDKLESLLNNLQAKLLENKFSESDIKLIPSNSKNTILGELLRFSIINNIIPYVELLIKNNAPLNYQDSNGNYLVHNAVQSNNSEGLRKLIDKGADINLTNRYGEKPIDLAEKKCKIILVAEASKSEVNLKSSSKNALNSSSTNLNKSNGKGKGMEL